MTAPALTVEALSAGYGRRRVIDRLSLEPFAPGELVALVGPNAAGKSTLLRALAGVLPATGTVRHGDANLLSSSLAERAERIGFMPQTAGGAIALTVFESVLSALKTASAPGTAAGHRRAAAATIEALGLAPVALRPLPTLSGGQRQLASFAQAIVREPAILLLDEPTSALDLRYQAAVMATAKRLAAEGRIVVAVLHDLSLAARWADRIVVLRGGRRHSQGEPGAVLTPAMLADVYGVAARVEPCGAGRLQVIVDAALTPAFPPPEPEPKA